MNSFAHALPFLDRDGDPEALYAIGCALPDWLGEADRGCRIRKKGASRFLEDSGSPISRLAAGVIRHIDDDRWFHAGTRFSELTLAFSVELRDLLVDDPGFRPGFLGHILIELLLDAHLSELYPEKLDRLYDRVGEVDARAIQNAVNRMATRPTEKLVNYFTLFIRERYLYDYVDDKRLIYRSNRVLQRVKLKPITDELDDWLPSARQRVYASAGELLEHYAMDMSSERNG